MVEVLKPVAPFLRRPPTPPLPKHESSRLPRPSATSESSLSYAAVNTPEDSPSSSAEYFRDTSGKTRKKVVISHRMEYHLPPSSDSKGNESDDLRRLPPSKECRSNRPILKPSSGHPSTGNSNAWAFDTGNLPAMLQSAIQHMAADSLTSRLDAYSSLLACLSAYEDVPGSDELSVKVKEVTGYLKRDIALGDLPGDSLHVQLIAQALKLVVIFLCTPNLCSNIPDDFRLFIIERSISRLGDDNCPKPLMGHYMHILEKQKFSSRLMTVERVNRLLTNLDNPIGRMKDSRVLGLRLMIYLRLLGQAKSVILARVESWLHHLVSGLLSSTKDVRARAISFGTEAGVQLGTSRSMSQAWLDMSNNQSSEGKKVIDILHKRLRDWADSKEYGAHVPQIWSIPLLFLRSRRRQLEGWEHLGSWVGLLQGCFNSSDDKIKFSANLAWRRFIFAVNLDTDTSKKVAALLKVPIASQLERKGNGRSSKMELNKQVPRDTYNALLYYGLRPSASQAQLDQYWDLYIIDLIPKCFSESKLELGHACQILASLLFNNGPSRVWSEGKANMNDPIRVGELPTLDSRWVRSRVSKVMIVFDKLLHETDCLRNVELRRLIAPAWRNFTLAIGHASSKEVKPSSETVVAVVSLTNQFKRLLDQPVHDQGGLDECYEFIGSLLSEAITHLGHLAFNEKRLILTDHQQYEAASDTPSSRSKNISTKPNSATYHLLTIMLAKTSEQGNQWYASIVSQLVNSLLESTHSRRGRLAVLRSLLRPSGLARESHEALWRVVSSSANAVLDPSHNRQSQQALSDYPGQEYRDAFAILEAGMAQPLGNGLASWLELYSRIAGQIKDEVGAAAITLVMPATLLETISNQLHRQETHTALAAAVKIVEHTSWPSSQHSVDRMEVLLWGANYGHFKPLSTDLTDDHCAMIDLALLKAYAGCDEGSIPLSTSLITAVTAIVHACPLPLKHQLLGRIQGGLAAWFEDANKKTLELEDGLFLNVRTLWALVATSIENLPESSNELLSGMATLITASLQSRHKTILNDAVQMWNRKFGCSEMLDYPDELRSALLNLKLFTEVETPGLSDEQSQQVKSSPLPFIEVQADGDEIKLFNKQLKSREDIVKPPHVTARTVASPSSAERRSLGHTKSTPKTRLRHDDSQIQFQMVASPPIDGTHPSPDALTERQREVRERQQEDVAIYRGTGLAADPAPKPTQYKVSKLNLTRGEHLPSKDFVADDASPIFPPQRVESGILGSSPTPSSARRVSRDASIEDDLISSPLLGSSALPIHRYQDEKPTDIWAHDPAKKATNQKTCHNLGPGMLDEPQPGARGPMTDEGITQSDQEVFVDAQAEPQPSEETFHDNSQAEGHFASTLPEITSIQATRTPNQEEGEEGADPKSFFRSESSKFSTDDEQAAAQLIAEMEGAHSQERQFQKKTDTKVKQGKRRASLPSSVPRKKAKICTPASETTTAHEAPMPHESVADCVLISSKPGSLSQPPIKRERSESPSATTVIASVEETQNTSQRSVPRRSATRGKARATATSVPRRRSGRPSLNKQEANDDEQRSLPKRRTRKSTEPSLVARESPLSSDPLHDESPWPVTLSSSAAIGSRRASSRQVSQAKTDTAGPAPGLADNSTSGMQDVLDGFRGMCDKVRAMTLRPEEERALVTILFESMQQAHEAGRRYSKT